MKVLASMKCVQGVSSIGSLSTTALSYRKPAFPLSSCVSNCAPGNGEKYTVYMCMYPSVCPSLVLCH